MKRFVLIILSLFSIGLCVNAQYDVNLHFDKVEKKLMLNVRNNTEKIFTFRPTSDKKEYCSYVELKYRDKNNNILDKSEWLIYDFLVLSEDKGAYVKGQYLFDNEDKKYIYRIGLKRKDIYKIEVFVQIRARDIKDRSKIYRKELRQEYLWE